MEAWHLLFFFLLCVTVVTLNHSEVDGYRIEVIWIFGVCMCQINTQMSTDAQTDERPMLFLIALHYQCGYQRALIELM